MTRAGFLRWLVAAAAGSGQALPAASLTRARDEPSRGAASDAAIGKTMHRRPIPSSGEMLPLIGCGTWVGFDVAPGSVEYRRLQQVLRQLFDSGGSVVDSSPMYGRAEEVAGRLLEESGARQKAFIATKVWTTGRDNGILQMEDSLRLFRTEMIDLMQVHNLLDWKSHLPTLREWKNRRRIRYLGVTHYTASAYAELEKVMRSERLDFVQVNYSLDDRRAEQRILPLAAERGIAVLVNMPFGGGGLLRSLRNEALPPWAAEIGCDSWAQLLLKFVVGHPSVTCAIPGTANPEHMRSNALAGTGVLPDEAFRRRIVAAWRR